MYSLSSRCIRNGTQASPLSIQIVLSCGKRSGMPFTIQLVRCSMLCQVKPSACTAMKRLVMREPGIRPVERRVERERQPALLQRGVGLGIGIVVDAAIVRRGHHEADDALPVGEFQHGLVAGLGIVEGQIEHRLEARLLAEDLVAEPAIVGLRQPDLDLDPRTGGEIEHRRRKHAGDVDAHRVHPAPHQRDVAVRRRRDLLVAAPGIARDASADFLIGAVSRGDAAARRCPDTWPRGAAPGPPCIAGSR